MDYGNNDTSLTLRAIIDTAIDGIITINQRGIIETVNKAAAEMFQYDPQEIIGRNVKIIMPEPDHSAHDTYIKRFLETGERRIIGIGREVTGRKKDGTHFPIRLAVSRVQLNERIIFAGILHDLTDVQQARGELIALNAHLEMLVEERTVELEEVVNRLLSTNAKLEANEKDLKVALDKEIELNELKSRFVSMASHEFRTPLSTILSSASLIARYTTTEQNENREKHVQRIKSAVSNLSGILNDFLSLSKLEEGKVVLERMDTDIVAFCQTVIDEIQGMLKPGQVIQYDHTGEKKIRTDQKILKNILFNLVSNAIKYSSEGSTVFCSTQTNDETVVFRIRDEGIGIPPDEQKYLFNRFFRASNAEAIQGTGLGLNIVKEYVDVLNGRISFVSEEGKGSTFVVEIEKGT